MSMTMMVKAMNVQVGSAARKLVLLKLADHANDAGECWPSYQHIAEHCEMDRRSAMRHIRALIQQGLVTKEARYANGENRSNVYCLRLSGGGENLSPGGSDTMTPGSDTQPPGGGGTVSPRTSHSFEPVSEPSMSSATPARRVLEHLNAVAGRQYKAIESNTAFINARLKEHTEAELMEVVDRQHAAWKGDPRMEPYLRPATLFNKTKCAQYVGELGTPIPQGGSDERRQPVRESAADRVRRANGLPTSREHQDDADVLEGESYGLGQ